MSKKSKLKKKLKKNAQGSPVRMSTAAATKAPTQDFAKAMALQLDNIPDKPLIARNDLIIPKRQFSLWLTYAIFLQAFVAMVGSLYYGAFGDPVANLFKGNLFPVDAGFEPCELCWFSRILMYPIVAIALVGMLKDDKRATDYILPLSTIGMLLSIYHFGLQKLNFPNPFRCTLAVPCNALQVQYFGFVTIPLLGAIAFTFITACCLANWWLLRKRAI